MEIKEKISHHKLADIYFSLTTTIDATIRI